MAGSAQFQDEDPALSAGSSCNVPDAEAPWKKSGPPLNGLLLHYLPLAGVL